MSWWLKLEFFLARVFGSSSIAVDYHEEWHFKVFVRHKWLGREFGLVFKIPLKDLEKPKSASINS